MRIRILPTTVIVCQCLLVSQLAQAADVFVQLFPLTGEVRMRNKDATPTPFAYYSIGSDVGSLNGSPSVWRSISDTYDVSGNGFIDASTNWVKIADTSIELAEGVVGGPGGSLPAMRAISLGKIWNPNAKPVPDLVVDVQDANGQSANVLMEYALDGDYLRDGVVDQSDFNLWLQGFGSSTNLDADGNLNGLIDAADYLIWRDNLGKSIPSLTIGSGAASGGVSTLVVGAAVPEPESVMLLVLAFAPLLAWMSTRKRRRILYSSRSARGNSSRGA